MITKENAKQYQALLEAFIAGKTLQLYIHNTKEWRDINPGFSFSSNAKDYRVKPVVLRTRQYLFYYNGSKTFKIHTITWAEYCSYNPDLAFEAARGFIRWIDNWIETEV